MFKSIRSAVFGILLSETKIMTPAQDYQALQFVKQKDESFGYLTYGAIPLGFDYLETCEANNDVYDAMDFIWNALTDEQLTNLRYVRLERDQFKVTLSIRHETDYDEPTSEVLFEMILAGSRAVVLDDTQKESRVYQDILTLVANIKASYTDVSVSEVLSKYVSYRHTPDKEGVLDPNLFSSMVFIETTNNHFLLLNELRERSAVLQYHDEYQDSGVPSVAVHGVSMGEDGDLYAKEFGVLFF